MNSQQAKRSLLGLLISLLIHGAIVGALLWNWHKPSEAASNATGEISTTISMEMIQGMRVEEQSRNPNLNRQNRNLKSKKSSQIQRRNQSLRRKKNLRKSQKNQ